MRTWCNVAALLMFDSGLGLSLFVVTKNIAKSECICLSWDLKTANIQPKTHIDGKVTGDKVAASH